jgi:hypothetical protein
VPDVQIGDDFSILQCRLHKPKTNIIDIAMISKICSDLFASFGLQ